MSTTTPVLLSMRRISKSFPGVKALAGVDFNLRRGEVHALMGENGAGKSTLIKLLTGVYGRDQGQIFLEGREISPHSPNQAQELGISTVYQEINLVPTLSVAENIYLGRQPVKKFGAIDWNRIKTGAEAALARLNLWLDVKQQLSSYSIAIQQMVAIARALDFSAKILILDEPTSSLDTNEVNQLFTIMRKLKNEGLGIIFVTHFLDQVYEISDRVTVLRNGQLVGEFETASLPKVELIAKMMGKDLIEFDEVSTGVTTVEKAKAAPFMKVRSLTKKGDIAPFDQDFRIGEVLGLAGLLGSGRTEIARLLFGVDRADYGEIIVDGKTVAVTSPRKAIACGFGFCPEDRKSSGVIEELTVRENIMLALQARKGWFKAISQKTQEEIAASYIRALNISTPTANQKIKNLSGGNQQKVIVARWLASNPRFLILDEPTRGIDIGAKAEIQKLILSLSKEGMSILFISSELSEVVRCSHRVTVLRDRNKIAELSGEQITENAIMHTIAKGIN